MKQKKIIAGALLAATALLAVLSWVLLPQTVVTQIGGSGVSTMPKLAAVALPTLLGAGGAGTYLFSGAQAESKRKALLVAGVGVLLFLVMLAVNLAR